VTHQPDPPAGQGGAEGKLPLGATFDLDAFIASREKNVDNQDTEFAEAANKLQAAADAENTRRVGADRSIISNTIIFTYAIAIVVALFYILGRFPECTPENATNCQAIYGAWEKQANVLRDLITTAVLPVVTLMLGFYFGTETAKKAGDPS